jgi:hypothetical protein
VKVKSASIVGKDIIPPTVAGGGWKGRAKGWVVQLEGQWTADGKHAPSGLKSPVLRDVTQSLIQHINSELLHYARKQMKVLVNNKSELCSSLESDIEIGKLMWYSAPRT